MARLQRNDLTIYDETADAWWSDEIRWIRTLRNMVPARLDWFDRFIDWNGARVLDLGCAGGFMSEAMTERGAVVTGIDPSEGAIAAAREHAAISGLSIEYDTGVGEALPYADGAFSAVVCVDVLEHVADLNRVVAEVARVLAPGGVFLFDTINRNPLSRFATITMAEDVLRILPRGTHDPELYIRPDELRVVVEAAGLKQGPFAGLGPRGLDRRGDMIFGRVPGLVINYMGVATKPAP